MSEWITMPLGEICKRGGGRVQTGPFGSQLHESDYRPEGIPVVMPTNISAGKISTDGIARVPDRHAERLRRHQLNSGDIVYGRRGDIGRQALVRRENNGWLCGTGCLRISLGEGPVVPEFLHRYLATRAVVGWIGGQAVGATMPNLNTNILERVPVTFPESRLTQQKVAAVLSAYDDLIEDNRRRIALLEQMAEQVYREWFVRFRFPGYLLAKFEKGRPASWGTRKLPELATITYGFPFEGQRFNSDGIGKPIIRIRNILDASTNDYTDEVANEKYLVRSGDLLIGMDGGFHMNHWHGDEAYLVQRVCRIRPKRPELAGYLSWALRAPIKHFESTIVGATVGHLGAMHLNAVELAVPDGQATEAFELLNQLLMQKLTLSRANDQLGKTRDLLLPRLVSGKLCVDNVDIQFPASMQAECS